MDAVDGTPRAEFFEESITDANKKVPLVLKVSPSGQLIHVMLVDDQGAVKSNERRLGLGAKEINNLMGRMLTLADATLTDEIQRKAYKDMIRQHFREWITQQENSGMASAGLPGWVGRPFNESIPEFDRESLMP